MLSSHGPGLARDLYVNIFLTLPGDNSRCVVYYTDSQNWKGYPSFNVVHNLLSNPDFRLSPEMLTHPIQFNIHLEEPFTNNFHYKIVYGCLESPTKKIDVITTPEEINSKLRKFLKESHSKNAANKIIKDIMKTEVKDLK